MYPSSSYPTDVAADDDAVLRGARVGGGIVFPFAHNTPGAALGLTVCRLHDGDVFMLAVTIKVAFNGTNPTAFITGADGTEANNSFLSVPISSADPPYNAGASKVSAVANSFQTGNTYLATGDFTLKLWLLRVDGVTPMDSAQGIGSLAVLPVFA